MTTTTATTAQPNSKGVLITKGLIVGGAALGLIAVGMLASKFPVVREAAVEVGSAVAS